VSSVMYHADRREEKLYSQAEGDVKRQSEPSLWKAPAVGRRHHTTSSERSEHLSLNALLNFAVSPSTPIRSPSALALFQTGVPCDRLTNRNPGIPANEFVQQRFRREVKMVRMFIRHVVRDYRVWRRAYNAFDKERRGMGVVGHTVYRAVA